MYKAEYLYPEFFFYNATLFTNRLYSCFDCKLMVCHFHKVLLKQEKKYLVIVVKGVSKQLITKQYLFKL